MMCGLDLELGINRNTRESKRSRKKRGEKYSLLTEIPNTVPICTHLAKHRRSGPTSNAAVADQTRRAGKLIERRASFTPSTSEYL
jgi:hypothetical protein